MLRWLAFGLLAYTGMALAYIAGRLKDRQPDDYIYALMLIAAVWICAAGWVMSC